MKKGDYIRDKSLKFLLSKSVPKETRPGIDEVWLHTNLRYAAGGVGGNHLVSALNRWHTKSYQHLT